MGWVQQCNQLMIYYFRVFPSSNEQEKNNWSFLYLFFGMCRHCKCYTIRTHLVTRLYGARREKAVFQALPCSPFVTMLVRILCCSNFEVKITVKSYFLEDICSILCLALYFKNNKFMFFLLDWSALYYPDPSVIFCENIKWFW